LDSVRRFGKCKDDCGIGVLSGGEPNSEEVADVRREEEENSDQLISD
jgi:hypothetical protein